MNPLLLFYLAVLPLLSSAQHILSSRQYYSPTPDSDSNSDSDSTPSSSPTSPSSNSTSTGTIQGDGACLGPMCITATVVDNNINYQLTSTGKQSVGFMAMGWGTQMVGSDMVIMWANANGDITLSQRKASARAEPSVQENPSVQATLSQTLFSDAGDNTAFAFSVPYASEGNVDLIWSFGPTIPPSSAVDARLVQHSASGRLSLDLSLTSDKDPHSIATGEDEGGSSLKPLSNYQKMMVAHGLLCTLGFIVFLPIGALLARLWRTFSNKWFWWHQTIQLFVAGFLIVVGVILGIVATHQAGDAHFGDKHKKFGIALFGLYFVQITLGWVIHTFKTKSGKRPPQNYLHAVIGLTIIGGAFYQVRSGYKVEYPTFVGREVSGAVNIVWIAWAAVVTLAYVAGLSMLRRQYRKEAEFRREREHVLYRPVELQAPKEMQ